jgi:hypothetical protein
MVEQGDTPAFKPELNGHRGAAIPVGGEKLFQRSWCRHPDLCFLIGGGAFEAAYIAVHTYNISGHLRISPAT